MIRMSLNIMRRYQKFKNSRRSETLRSWPKYRLKKATVSYGVKNKDNDVIYEILNVKFSMTDLTALRSCAR